MNEPGLPTPKAIQVFTDRMLDELKVTATAEIGHVRGHRWRVTITSARVRMWVEWEVHSRGRLQWGQSTLFIDNAEAPRAHSYADLLDVFNDPDNTNPGEAAVHEPVAVGPADAPAAVVSAYNLATKRAAGDAKVAITKAGKLWTVTMSGARFRLGFRFLAAPMDPTRPLAPAEVNADKSMPISLVVDGVDRSAEVQGRIDKALAMVVSHTAATPAPPIAAPSDVQTTATSVVTRQQRVIRR